MSSRIHTTLSAGLATLVVAGGILVVATDAAAFGLGGMGGHGLGGRPRSQAEVRFGDASLTPASS